MTASATVHALPSAQRLARNAVSVASGKGVVGKTWFSITLAYTLARAGRRTLLFDGDLGLANVDIQLGLVPNRDLGDVIAGRCRIGEAIQPFAAGRFDIVAGKSGSGTLAQLAPQRLRDLRDAVVELARGYDTVIADLAAGVEANVQTLATLGGPILVVVNDEPTSLTDAYALIKTLYLRSPRADIRVVVNSAAAKPAGQKTYETLLRVCESFLKFSPPLAGVVRADAKVKDAIRHQMPLPQRHPTADAAADVDVIAQRLSAP